MTGGLAAARNRRHGGQIRKRLESHAIRGYDVNELSVRIDGADETGAEMHMITSGGALTRERIVAALAKRFVCIADGWKPAPVFGSFPPPSEVIPVASAYVTRE